MLTFLLAFVSLARLFRNLFQQPESRALLFMAATVIGVGTLFYHNVEGWRWLDALYFCVVTLVTIGYGDCPGLPRPPDSGCARPRTP
jgi:hypothetical protein